MPKVEHWSFRAVGPPGGGQGELGHAYSGNERVWQCWRTSVRHFFPNKRNITVSEQANVNWPALRFCRNKDEFVSFYFKEPGKRWRSPGYLQVFG